MTEYYNLDWKDSYNDIVICGYCGRRIRRDPSCINGINYHEHCKKYIKNDEGEVRE